VQFKIAGQEASGDKYYIGRAKVANTLSVGKVHVAHKGCYVTNGTLHIYNIYTLVNDMNTCLIVT